MTGRHVSEFLRLYHNGQILGDHAVATMAEQAIHADLAERRTAQGRQGDRASSAVQAAQALDDDRLYDLLFPSAEEAARRADIAASERERRARRELTDSEYEALFGPES